jgi:hypothetical protein
MENPSRQACRDGRVICVSLTLSPVTDGYGRIIGACKPKDDVTLIVVKATSSS